MTERAEREELFDLLGATSNETITPEQHERLEQILSEDGEARRFYLDYVHMESGLRQLQRRDEEALPLSILLEQLAV